MKNLASVLCVCSFFAVMMLSLGILFKIAIVVGQLDWWQLISGNIGCIFLVVILTYYLNPSEFNKKGNTDNESN